MPKSPVSGYIVPKASFLANIDTSLLNNGYAVILGDKKTWSCYDSSLENNSLSVFNKFQQIPINANQDKNTRITFISISDPTYTLDFSNCTKFIDITLTSNTTITPINILNGEEYIIAIHTAGYLIENILELFSYSLDVTPIVLFRDFVTLILKINYTSFVAATVVYKELQTQSKEHQLAASPLFSAPFLSDFSDTSNNQYSVTVEGFPSIANNWLSLNSGRLIYVKDTELNLNETNFSIEFWIQLNTGTENGSILSIWSDLSKQFWIRVDNGQLIATFNESSGTVNLTSILSSRKLYHVYISRFRDVYRLFVNGVQTAIVRSTNFMEYSTANLIVGRLQNAVDEGIIANTSFNGLISNVSISKEIANVYAVEFTPKPKTNESLLYRFFLDNKERSANRIYQAISDTSTYPFLTENERNGLSALNKYHHFEIDGSFLNVVDGTDFTAELWIKNVINNPRGTLLQFGNNWHLGIFDNKLRLDVNTLQLESVNDVPLDTWVHVAFTREGAIYRLYLNGVLEDSETSTVSMISAGIQFPLSVKKGNGQDNTIANLNTTLYPSKSHIYIDNIRIEIGRAVYTENTIYIPEYV